MRSERNVDTAVILYAVNGTTKKLKVTGPHIAVQIWPDGPGCVVTVHTEDGGPVLRALYITTAYIVDRRTEEPNPDAIR